jgi:membrane protein
VNSQTLSSQTGPAFLIGGIGLVLGAIGIFGQLQKSMNNILHIKVGPDAGLKRIIRQKIVSLGLVGLICFLVMVSLLASALTSTLAANLLSSGFWLGTADFGLSLLVFSVLLTLLYRTLPEVKLPWKVLFKTSLVVALFFSLGKTVLGAIIGNNSSISAFGAAGSLIALLLWIFYSGQIIYLGTAAIAIHAEKHPLEMRPKYKGKKGVLRVRKIEEPLATATMNERLKHKFAKGWKEGWQKKKG